MVISCVAFNCTKRQTDKTVSFHRFPHQDPILLKLWILAVRRHDWYPTKLSYLCSSHFKEEDFACVKGPNRRPRLKKDAVPSVFDYPHCSSLQAKSFHLKKSAAVKAVFDYPHYSSLQAKSSFHLKKSAAIKTELNNSSNFHLIKKYIVHDHTYL